MLPGFLVAGSLIKIVLVALFLHVLYAWWSSFSEMDAAAWIKQRNSDMSATSMWHVHNFSEAPRG